MQGLWDEVQEAATFLRTHWTQTPAVGLILGTGLGGLARQIKVDAEIPYGSIPHFPRSTAPSHAGKLLCGTLEGVPVMAMEGRFHYYEGYSLRQVTFPIRVMKAMGAGFLFLTSAVGGMNPQYSLADLIIIEDHINLMPDNPLRGINDDRLGPRFPDMSQPYDRTLVEAARRTTLQLGIAAHKGVLVAVPGPNLETRAEYRMLRQMGADIVGMSTVPECITAVHAGLRTVAFSIVTDMCLPDALEPAEIEKILKVAAEGGARLERLLIQLFRDNKALLTAS
ncbi:MAG: purine-nucleoside phosphorylase [Planctomycetaceae bacterium]|nr:purine-nucleoside phosphorylase [Planctomycetaceae bacterium]